MLIRIVLFFTKKFDKLTGDHMFNSVGSYTLSIWSNFRALAVLQNTKNYLYYDYWATFWLSWIRILVRLLSRKKLNFYMKNILYVTGQKTPFLKGRNQVYLYILFNIPNTDPEPRQPMNAGIHNTARGSAF
jgi:hypothetical protein